MSSWLCSEGGCGGQRKGRGCSEDWVEVWSWEVGRSSGGMLTSGCGLLQEPVGWWLLTVSNLNNKMLNLINRKKSYPSCLSVLLVWRERGSGIFSEVVSLDKPVIQDSLSTVVSFSRLKWGGELNESPFWVTSIPYLQQLLVDNKTVQLQ